MSAFERYRATARFGSLDGLRALSILAVIWHHGPGDQSNVPLVRDGFLGVHLFFAISGFLITTLLLRERSETGNISLRHFYLRRALRIFPLYYLTIALYVVLVAALRRDEPAGAEFFSNLPYFLTYTSNWFVPPGTSGAAAPIFFLAWSLATEEQFYCTWPWFERYARHPWPVVIITLVSLSALALSAGWMQWALPSSGFLTTVIRSVSAPICLGVLLAHVLDSASGFRLALPLLGNRASSPAIAAMLPIALILEAPAAVIYCLLVLLVGACVITEDHALAPVLRTRMVARIGVVAYGMYLFHPLVYNLLTFIDRPLRILPDRKSVLGWMVATSITFVIAHFSYNHFEAPFLRLKRRFASDSSSSRSTSSSGSLATHGPIVIPETK